MFAPPANLYMLSKNYKQCDPHARRFALEMRGSEPQLLRLSFRHWILTALKDTPQEVRISTRHINNVVYGHRGLKSRELTEFCGAAGFADAVQILTGICVSHRDPQTNKQGPVKGGQSGDRASSVNMCVDETLSCSPGERGILVR